MLTQPPLLPPLSPYLARQDADRKSGFLHPDRRHRESVHAFRTTKEGLARASQKCLCRRTSLPPYTLTQPPLLPPLSRAPGRRSKIWIFGILTDVTESPYTLSERRKRAWRGPAKSVCVGGRPSPPILSPSRHFSPPYLARQDADRKSGFWHPDRRHRESVHAFRTTKEGLARASQKCLCRRTSIPPYALTQPPLLPHISRARTQIENLDFCILTDVTESPYTLSERRKRAWRGPAKSVCVGGRPSPPYTLTQPPLLPHISRARTQIENLDFCILTDVTESPYTLSERRKRAWRGPAKSVCVGGRPSPPILSPSRHFSPISRAPGRRSKIWIFAS